MCLAVPGRVLETRDDQAVVDLQGNKLTVSKVLTPDVSVGDWVLIHAGFIITQVEEREAMETWDYLREALGEDVELAGAPSPPEEPAP